MDGHAKHAAKSAPRSTHASQSTASSSTRKACGRPSTFGGYRRRRASMTSASKPSHEAFVEPPIVQPLVVVVVVTV